MNPSHAFATLSSGKVTGPRSNPLSGESKLGSIGAADEFSVKGK